MKKIHLFRWKNNPQMRYYWLLENVKYLLYHLHLIRIRPFSVFMVHSQSDSAINNHFDIIDRVTISNEICKNMFFGEKWPWNMFRFPHPLDPGTNHIFFPQPPDTSTKLLHPEGWVCTLDISPTPGNSACPGGGLDNTLHIDVQEILTCSFPRHFLQIFIELLTGW